MTRCRDCKRILFPWTKVAMDVRPTHVHCEPGYFFIDYICERCWKLITSVAP